MIGIFIILLGLVIGSFLNVCIFRIPLNKSIVHPRSHCPNCEHQLKAWENIPVISYLILMGKCSSCGTKITFRYPVVELFTACLFMLVYLRFGLSLDLLIYMFFVSLIVVITFIDLDHQIIPNRLLLIGLIPALYPVLSNLSDYSQYVAGAFSLGLGFFLIRLLGQIIFKKESMGMGDVKYAALIGLILGWVNGLVAIALAFLSASLIIIAMMIFNQTSMGQRIPFGPFLSIGTLVALFWGSDIIRWYLNLVL